MKRGMGMPRKYVQGDGVLAELAAYTELLGKKPLVLWGPHARQATEQAVTESYSAAGLVFLEELFPGESTKQYARALAARACEQGAGVLVGVGGGKVVDTAKGAAHYAGLPVIVVPTVAATDAPLTSTSGWYNDAGLMEEILVSPFNPDILLVDTGVIVRSPKRLFVAGMGDAITTFVEVDAVCRAGCTTTNRVGGLPTMATRAISRLCFDTLLECGEEALHCLETGAVTPLFEDVVETLVLHSGLGGESGGIAVAHSIANNLPWFSECRAYHGEMVAFGVVVQLVLENAFSLEETYRIIDFMARVGLPVTLAGLGIEDAPEERLRDFARHCLQSEVSFFEGMPAEVTEHSLCAALLAADNLGRRRNEVAATDRGNPE